MDNSGDDLCSCNHNPRFKDQIWIYDSLRCSREGNIPNDVASLVYCEVIISGAMRMLVASLPPFVSSSQRHVGFAVRRYITKVSSSLLNYR
ncbi:hypothetical protein V1477_015902 [Vespula maculifrons]|uniref:Uncharacterized protein n=1 Tax=Vespula maculifrons TaxID=7453 RepID=A0ABD2BBH6_VESMC